MKCGTIVGHDNVILRHFIAKIVFLRGSDHLWFCIFSLQFKL